MKDMKEFGIKCQEMQRDLDCAQKRLAEYYAQSMDSLIRINIEAVINKPLPMDFEKCKEILLEEKITLIIFTQQRTEQLPKKIYVIQKDGRPVRFFEIKFTDAFGNERVF